MQLVLNKYIVALLQIAIVGLTAFTVIPTEELNPTSLTQLGIMVGGAVVTYLVPLLQSDNPLVAGLVKTGVAVITAIATALIPYFSTGTLTLTQWGIVALAAVNALATQVGVDIRKDTEPVAAVVGPDGAYNVASFPDDPH